MDRKRLDWIDAIKGFGMILVIWGHINIPLAGETIIYTFHMALFFFLSGYLIKENVQRGFTETVKKKSAGLLIPYVLFGLISIAIDASKDVLIDRESFNVLYAVKSFFYINGSTGLNAPLWFLVSLFLVEVLNAAATKFNINKLFVLLASAGIGFVFSQIGHPVHFGLHTVFIGLFFYTAARYCKEWNVIERAQGSISKYAFVLTALAAVNIVFGFILNPRISFYNNIFGNYLYFLIAALAGCLFTMVLFRGIKREVRILNYYGRNTLLLLSTQYILFFGYGVVEHIIGTSFMTQDSYITSAIITAFTLLLYIPIIFIVDRFFPFLVGKRFAVRSGIKQVKAA